MTRNEFYKNLKLNAQYLFKVGPKSWINKPDKSISVQGKLGILTVSFDRNVIVTQFTPEKGEPLAKLENGSLYKIVWYLDEQNANQLSDDASDWLSDWNTADDTIELED